MKRARKLVPHQPVLCMVHKSELIEAKNEGHKVIFGRFGKAYRAG